jgi:hypothetical protein
MDTGQISSSGTRHYEEMRSGGHTLHTNPMVAIREDQEGMEEIRNYDSSHRPVGLLSRKRQVISMSTLLSLHTRLPDIYIP